MASRKVELLLGSDIGAWVAEWVDPEAVAAVVSTDTEILTIASKRGFAVGDGPLGAEIGVSVHFPRVLSNSELARYESCYNFHPGYLPWGRGHFPLVWAIWLEEPAGVTLHRVTARLDGGPIIDQTRVRVLPNDTGGTLFTRIRRAERSLIRAWWPRLLRGDSIAERPQELGGSYHSKADFNRLTGTNPRDLAPDDLSRLRRALTFPGKPGLAGDGASTPTDAAMELL